MQIFSKPSSDYLQLPAPKPLASTPTISTIFNREQGCHLTKDIYRNWLIDFFHLFLFRQISLSEGAGKPLIQHHTIIIFVLLPMSYFHINSLPWSVLLLCSISIVMLARCAPWLYQDGNHWGFLGCFICLQLRQGSKEPGCYGNRFI